MNLPVIVDHLGWVLIHSLWQFAAIALIAGIFVWMLRRSSSSVRYGMWVVAMAVSVAAPVVTWMVLSIEEPPFAAAVPLARAEAIAPVPIEPIDEALPLPRGITMVGDLPPTNTELRDPPLIATAPPVEIAPRPTLSEHVSALLRPWMAWIVAGWSLGVGLCSLRPLLGWHTLRCLRTSGVAPVSDDIRAALRRVSERLRLRQTVQVLQSTLSQVPVVVGYLRPVILLPVSLLTNMPPAQLEAILAHELAHIRRHDFIVNLLQTLVETLFFYHPAVWWLSRQIRVEREHCCDDLVVAALGNRVEYGRALLAIEELRGERTLLALGANDGSLLSRIRRIVGVRADRTVSSPWMGVVFVACLFGLIGSVSVLGWTASKEKRPDPLVEAVNAAADEGDVQKSLEPPKPALAEWANGRSIELVGITKNTAPAKDGWMPSGLPIGDVGYWKSTTVLHGGNTSASYLENGPHPEPDADALDFLFRFRGLKAQPSLTFDMPTTGSSYSHWPVSDPYNLRVSARKRPVQPPPGGKWMPPDGVVRVGITDEPWGRYVKISPEGEVLDPIQPGELYASTYKLIDVRGSKPHDRISTGTAILIREPSAHTDPDHPDHRYVFEFRAIDTDGKEHWAMQWEGRGVEKTAWIDSQYGLAQPLPAGRTLSHYEYRLRPFRHWITFENVSLEPGPQTDVKFMVASWPAVPSQLKVLSGNGRPATFNAVTTATVGYPQNVQRSWVGWRNKHGLVPLTDLPFGTHWIVAAGEFEQRSIFPLTYPNGEKEIEWRLRKSEPWTQKDLEFKTRFEPGAKTGGEIVITIKNKFDKPLKLTEADFSLHVGERTMHRVMTPQWGDGQFTPVEIAAGQTGEVRLNWNDWVRKGFWATRDSETISEPGLPANEPGLIYVRVCLGNSGALPIAVTDPAVILADAEPQPFPAKKKDAGAAVNDKHAALQELLVTIIKADRETGEPTTRLDRRSGVLVDERGYLLTTSFSGDTDDDRFQIRLKDQTRHTAKVVAIDRKLSVTLLKISTPKPLRSIALEKIPSVKVHDRVTAVLADRQPPLLTGLVTATGVNVSINADLNFKNLIQTDLPFIPGDGGCLVVNEDSQPVGLCYAIRAGKQRLGFAIPMADIGPFVTRAILLDTIVQQPQLKTLQKLLALADGKHSTPTELLDDSRRYSGNEKMGGEVKVVFTGQEKFAIVSAKVIPLIEPSDIAMRVDPERQAECAFVFDMQGRLIDTIGGKLTGGNSLGGDDVQIVNLGPEEDWFVRVMNFEKRGELNYRSDFYRIAIPVVKSFRFYNLPNACAWSNGPEKIPRQGRLHPAHPKAERRFYAGIPKEVPVTTAAGVPTLSTIVWDGDRNRWIAAPSAFVKGLPLYEVDTTWSREFEPLEPQSGQLIVEGGIREFDHWSAWEATVPDQGDSTVVLTIPQRDGPAKVIETKLTPGRHTVQLQAKAKDNGSGVELKLWIDDNQKLDFDLPFAFGDAFTNHPPIVHVLKPSESARLVHHLLKDTTAALLLEIKHSPLRARSSM